MASIKRRQHAGDDGASKAKRAKPYRVKVKPQQVRVKDLVGFQPGSHCIVSGQTGRGKTKYVVDMLLGTGVHANHKSQHDAVVVMCDRISIDQPDYQRLKRDFKGRGGVRFVEGIPLDVANADEEGGEAESPQLKFIERLRKNRDKGFNTLLIIDDLMNASKVGQAERFVSQLYSSARHLKTDVWELTQVHTGSRHRRLNCGYLVLFATPADVQAIKAIGMQIKPETKGRDIIAAYREATESHGGHGCLVICLHEKPEFMFRNTSMDICFDLTAPPVDGDGAMRVGAKFY